MRTCKGKDMTEIDYHGKKMVPVIYNVDDFITLLSKRLARKLYNRDEVGILSEHEWNRIVNDPSNYNFDNDKRS